MNERFSEEQIIGILKGAEAGKKEADVCRQRGSIPRCARNAEHRYAVVGRFSMRVPERRDRPRLSRAGSVW